ncbi:serine/threonine protein phosphatase [Oscillospiraceae bacterium PP1C4]
MRLRDLWKRGANALSVQTVRESISSWNDMLPLYSRDCAVYDGLRKAIPVIDAAIDKIGRLVGGCAPICSNRQAQEELTAFFQNVRVGAMSAGMDSFIRCYLDSLLTYGNAVGEIVLSGDGTSVAGLYNAPVDNIHFKNVSSPLDVQVCVAKNGLTPIPVSYPQLIVYSALCPKAGEVRGNSILSGLPFVSEVLMKIYASIGQNFERVANLRYAVTYKPNSSSLDRAYAKEIAGSIAKEWADAMNATKTGQIKDFVAVGDVDIKVIGADNQMIDTEIPVRQMLEQIVAKLGIPPFLLGLNWSTTERMSAQQADILTSELESYRRLLTPVLVKICTVFLRLRGYTCGVDIQWDNINLQDELELANARLTNLHADKLALELKQLEVEHK